MKLPILEIFSLVRRSEKMNKKKEELIMYRRMENSPAEWSNKTDTVLLYRLVSPVWCSVLIYITLVFCFLLLIMLLISMSTQHTRYKLQKLHRTGILNAQDMSALYQREGALPTFFVDTTDHTERDETWCSVESYLKAAKHKDNVFYFYIRPKADISSFRQESIIQKMAWHQLQDHYPNFKMIFVDLDLFINKTIFGEKYDRELAAKLLTLWRFRGRVIDLGWLTVRSLPENMITGNEDDLIIDLKYASLIESRVSCHRFVYDMIVTLWKHIGTDISYVHLVKKSVDRYCNGRRVCKGIKSLHPHYRCKHFNQTNECVFVRMSSVPDYLRSKYCPLYHVYRLEKLLN